MWDKKPELLAPAGDLERLKMALHYGADAVYVGGKEFSLRAQADNFSLAELQEGIEFAHSLGKRVYLTINIFAHNCDLELLADYLKEVAALQPDAFIVSDPGVFSIAQELAPKIPLHISTQANNTNWRTAAFWRRLGAKRIILARELSLVEAAEVADRGGLGTEIFVHGAMCVSYSGRCLLSSFLTGRDANQGDCTHPCRWHYRLEEEKRPGEYLPIEEDARGTYIMNSKDLALLPYLPQLLDAGAESWKIEGRNKSSYYVANITRIYRCALDAAFVEQADFSLRPQWLEELAKVSHREYTSAFAFGKPQAEAYRYTDSSYKRGYDFAGVVQGQTDNELIVQQRNHLALGDQIEIILPNGSNISLSLTVIYNEEHQPIDCAPHPKQRIFIPYHGDKLPTPLIIRRPSR